MSGANKPDLRCVLGHLAAAVAEVVRLGDEKHGKDTWRELDPVEFEKASIRHITDMVQGENTDKESGLPHEAHLVINALYRYEVRTAEERTRKHLPLESSLRLQDVDRWHIVQTGGVRQSVADHTYGVQVIGRRLLVLLGRPDLMGEFLAQALEHDEHESLEGDAPSPTKDKVYTGLSVVEQVLKAADLMEAYRFVSFYGQGVYSKRCYQELGVELVEFGRLYPHLQEAIETATQEMFHEPAKASDSSVRSMLAMTKRR